ncbi:DeoR/GlpR family DNA-binding transcription regulator [Profundibacterium mesophilum]|uniref:Glycerol-3-phosphate regulon repressor n=1 Tax=Profundibacterium mesophilum KAUST100406-0324 TaxID=1037889 RepID=A0A921TCA8_9RHOB|nr:DeoR/GlpR family DNA-binding transcription regulator [Profundibacterium mesophilum]KAF0674667.1 putative glycerol-3-phosphate regulon repressor [Profundibacterium mesophilum KAUST100406-0324]
MSLGFRQSDILEIARREGKVTVDGLAEQFGVTVQTIRRDLSELADAGHISRVHGGAILSSGTTNLGYEDRRALHEAAKEAIAARCAEQIPDGAALFLSIGTSTEAVARALSGHRGLLVVTNNMNVAHILAGHARAEVIVTGGTLRPHDGGLTGGLTNAAIRQFRFDIAVIGCSALDPGGDLLDFDHQEVEAGQTILAHARRSFLVADHSKFSRAAPVRIASLRDIDRFFTDLPPPAPLPRLCAQWRTEIVTAGSEEAPAGPAS